MTNNENIVLFELTDENKLLDSSYDLYNSDELSILIPNSFSLVNFYPEFDYFTNNILKKPSNFDQHQRTMLFNDATVGDVQTLMNPVNLHNFFEHYKLGDFDAIRKHFSYDYVNTPMSNDEIEGLM